MSINLRAVLVLHSIMGKKNSLTGSSLLLYQVSEITKHVAEGAYQYMVSFFVHHINIHSRNRHTFNYKLLTSINPLGPKVTIADVLIMDQPQYIIIMSEIGRCGAVIQQQRKALMLQFISLACGFKLISQWKVL